MAAGYRSLACIVLKLFIALPFYSTLVNSVSPDYSNQTKYNDSPNERRLLLCDLYGQIGLGYYVQLLVGEPHQLMNVLIDTGSSNFAVAAAPNPKLNGFYNVSRSTSLHKVNRDIFVPYTEGSWQGFLATDTIQLPDYLNLTNFTANIAFITDSKEFFIDGSNWQGILGLAYSTIAKPDSSIEPWFDSLIKSTQLDDVFTIQLCGATEPHSKANYNVTGTLTFGAVDHTQYVAELLYVPLLHMWFYEVVITDISVGDSSLSLDCKDYNNDKTIVDSGTTDLRLPDLVYSALLKLLKEKTKIKPPGDFWSQGAVLCWNQSRTMWDEFPTMSLSLASTSDSYVTLKVAPRQYIRSITPKEEKEGGINVTLGQSCYKLAIAKSDSGTVLGSTLMEGFYVVFDRQHKRVGFAQTRCDGSKTSNKGVSHVEGPFIATENTSKCVYITPRSLQPKDVVAYAILAILLACLVGLLLWIVFQRAIRVRQQPHSSDDFGDLLMQRELS